MSTELDICDCGSKEPYESCCGVFHSGEKRAPNAELLMKSRYSAYARVHLDYLVSTIPLLQRKAFDRKATKEWAQNSEWKGLEIVSVKETHGGKKARVEFKASYVYDSKDCVHHELSTFENINGRWFFLDGKVIDEGA